MKKLLALTCACAALFTLSACDVAPSHKTESLGGLEGALSDCHAYKTWIDGSIYSVVRCPNSATTTEYRAGKTSITTVTIDGQSYVQASSGATKDAKDAKPSESSSLEVTKPAENELLRPARAVVIDGVEYVAKDTQATAAAPATNLERFFSLQAK